MGIDDSLIAEIVRRLLSVMQPDRIILFGSAVRGPMTPDGDIDLLVIAPAPSNTIENRVRLLRALRGLGFPFDVFMIGSGKFEETKNIFGGIAYPAEKYGRVIYEEPLTDVPGSGQSRERTRALASQRAVSQKN